MPCDFGGIMGSGILPLDCRQIKENRLKQS